MAVAVAVAAGLAACTQDAPIATDEPPRPGSSTPTAQQTAKVPGHEVRADSATLETWALLYQPPPWPAGQEVKVVWRSTGAGEFEVVAVGPQLQQVAPVSGPTAHANSNWVRPGQEWGTFFRLDEPGEWVLRVSRGAGTATVPVRVISS